MTESGGIPHSGDHRDHGSRGPGIVLSHEGYVFSSQGLALMGLISMLPGPENVLIDGGGRN